MSYRTLHARYTSEESEIDVKFSQTFVYDRDFIEAVDSQEIYELYICGVEVNESNLPENLVKAIHDLSAGLDWE